MPRLTTMGFTGHEADQFRKLRRISDGLCTAAEAISMIETKPGLSRDLKSQATADLSVALKSANELVRVIRQILEVEQVQKDEHSGGRE